MSGPLLPNVESGDGYDELARTFDWSRAMRAVADRHDIRGPCARFATGTMIVFAGSDDDRVVKLFAPLWRETFDRERASLLHVDSRIGIDTPRIVAEGELDGWPYLLLTRVAGEPLERVLPRLARSEQLRALEVVGAAIAAMHALPVTSSLAPLERDWAAYLDVRIAGVVAQQTKRGLAPEWLAQLTPYLSRARRFLDDGRRALVHTELGPSHVLVVTEGDRATRFGVIDFGDALVGPPALELSAVALFLARGDPSLLGAYAAGAGLHIDDDERFRTQILAWTLLHPYANVPWYLREVPPPAGTVTLDELARAWGSISTASS